MAYKTFLTIVHSIDEAAIQIAAAAELSRRHDAHLDILCLGVDEVQVGYYFAGADAVLQQTSMTLAREKADALVAEATARIATEGVRHSVDAIVSQLAILGDWVAQAARFADLVVLPPPYGEDATVENEAVIEAVLFAAGAPVLIVPPDGLPAGFCGRAIVGWNESGEALRAARHAFPLLQQAERTEITVVDPPVRSVDRSPVGERLATLMDRHGISAAIAQLPKTVPRVADILLQRIVDHDADLLVTGAYGHSRLRESILGGATRDLMQRIRVPLLMAH